MSQARGQYLRLVALVLSLAGARPHPATPPAATGRTRVQHLLEPLPPLGRLPAGANPEPGQLPGPDAHPALEPLTRQAWTDQPLKPTPRGVPPVHPRGGTAHSQHGPHFQADLYLLLLLIGTVLAVAARAYLLGLRRRVALARGDEASELVLFATTGKRAPAPQPPPQAPGAACGGLGAKE